MKTLYHASPDNFDKFEIPYNGLHFGSFESAIQALDYKREKLKFDRFYLYKVTLDDSICEDVFDVGKDWKDYLEGDTTKVYSYTNKYEPSSSKSYVIFNTEFIKSLVSKQELNINDYECDLDKLFKG